MIISNQVKALALSVSIEIQLDESGRIKIEPCSSRIAKAICDYAQESPENQAEILSALSLIEEGILVKTKVGINLLMIFHSEINNRRYRYRAIYA